MFFKLIILKMKKQNAHRVVSNKKPNTEKLPYTRPKVTFTPQKMEEGVSSAPKKKGDWTIPFGCC